MKRFSEFSRSERIQKVIGLRKPDLVLVLEDLVEERNASAIIRTAEGFGVGRVCIIQSQGVKTKISSNISTGAVKWLKIDFFTSTKECLAVLKKDGFKIFGALVDPEAKLIWEEDFSGKVALVLGNEPNGLSKEAQKLVDQSVYIPMFGLTESFNVSVAAGIMLYEVVRQKEKKGIKNKM